MIVRQKREMVRLQNDRSKSVRVVLVLFMGVYLIGQEAPTAIQSPSAITLQTVPTEPNARPTVPSNSTSVSSTSAPQSGNAPAPQSGGISPQESKPEESKKDEPGMFVMRKQVDEVALHATVIDEKDGLITNLERSAFTVFEDGQPQPITSFHHEDVPVALGILIDNSGSMREKRKKVNQAALNLVRASNPQDEIIIVNFNDEGFLDQDFTSDIGKMKQALEKYDTHGSTALYDAVDGAATHLKWSAHREKKVIFVVTDGEDNASRDSLEKVVQLLQQEGAPAVYAIGVLGEEKQERARHELQVLAERTGGIAFFPKTLDEVDQISRTVAHDIRTQYSIGYKPTKPRSAGGYRVIQVEARAPSHHKMNVRTRNGYYAGQSSNPQN